MKRLLVFSGALLWCAQVLAQTVSVVVVGDIMLEGGPLRAMQKGRDPFASFAPLFKSADVRVGNLECVVATVGSVEPDKPNTFRVPPTTLKYVRKHFDAVGLANNHSGDYGRQAFAEMLGLLSKHQLAQAGGGMNLSEVHAPWIVERNGLRIAILSYSEFMPRSYEADSDAPGIAWSEDAQVVDDIRRARRVHRADIVLPLMHWGWENEPMANARQRQLAKRMIDAGADAVLGGHPHVTQDIEIYQGKPIVYSVGNFIMKETDNPQQRQGWVLRMDITAAGVQGFDTHVAQLNSQGLPTYDPGTPSPCWRQSEPDIRQCRASQAP